MNAGTNDQDAVEGADDERLADLDVARPDDAEDVRGGVRGNVNGDGG